MESSDCDEFSSWPTAAVEISISDDAMAASSEEQYDSWQHWSTADPQNLIFGKSTSDGRLSVGFAFVSKHFTWQNYTIVSCHPRRQFLRARCQLADDSSARFDVDYRFLKETSGGILFCVTVTNLTCETLVDTQSLEVGVVLQLRRDSGDSTHQLAKSGCTEVMATWSDPSSLDCTNTYYLYYEDDADEITTTDDGAGEEGNSRMTIRRCLNISAGASSTLSYRLCQSRCLFSPSEAWKAGILDLMSAAEASAEKALLCSLPEEPSLSSFGARFRSGVIRCLSWFLLNLPHHSASLERRDASAFYLIPLTRLDNSFVKQEVLNITELILTENSETDPVHWCQYSAGVIPGLVTTLLEIDRLYGSTQKDFVTQIFTALEQPLHRWFNRVVGSENYALRGDADQQGSDSNRRGDNCVVRSEDSFWSWYSVAKALELTSSLGLAESAERLLNLLLKSTRAVVNRQLSSETTTHCECCLCASGGLFPLLECTIINLNCISTATSDSTKDLSDLLKRRGCQTLNDENLKVEQIVYTDRMGSIGLVSRRLDCIIFRQACRCLFDPDKYLDKRGVRTTPSIRGCVSLPVNYLIIEALIAWETVFGDSLLLEYPTNSGKVTTVRRIIADICSRLLSSFQLADLSQPGIYECFDSDPGTGLASPDTWSSAFILNIAANYLKYTAASDNEKTVLAQEAPEHQSAHQLQMSDDGGNTSSAGSPNSTGSKQTTQIAWEYAMCKPLQFVEQLSCFSNQSYSTKRCAGTERKLDTQRSELWKPKQD